MNEDTLILYYYGDGLSDAERREVERALEGDASVASRYKTLCAELNAMVDSGSAPVPSHILERWHDAIDGTAQKTAVRERAAVRTFNPLSFMWGAVVTAALAVGIGIGITIGVDRSGGVPSIDNTGYATFNRGVAFHLRDTQQQLSALSPDNSDRTLLILDIVEQNRFYERAAEQNNSQDLARVLRAFEPILLRLAADDIAPADAEALRAQLAFELNVMLTKLARQPSNDTQST